MQPDWHQGRRLTSSAQLRGWAALAIRRDDTVESMQDMAFLPLPGHHATMVPTLRLVSLCSSAAILHMTEPIVEYHYLVPSEQGFKWTYSTSILLILFSMVCFAGTGVQFVYCTRVLIESFQQRTHFKQAEMTASACYYMYVQDS